MEISKAVIHNFDWYTFAETNTLIAIDNVLISDDVVEAKFVCDLHKCKGGCCEDGDAGAPLKKTS